MVPVGKVKGVGPKSLALLKKIGIESVDDLVNHYPFRYDVLVNTDVDNVLDGEKVIIDGKVESLPILLRFKGGLNKLNFRLVSNSKVYGVSIFNRAFLKSKLTIGTTVIVIGKIDKTKNIITASDIKFGSLSKEGKIEPIYHTTQGLNSKSINSFVNQALLDYGNDIEDKIPDYLIKKYNYSNKKTVLNIVHNPPSMDKVNAAAERLK